MPKAMLLLKNKISFDIIKGTGLLLAPVAFYFVPFAWLNNGHSLCVYKFFTGHDCYGCGTTRAIWSASHFHFTDAFHYNRLSVIVLPLLAYLWVKNALNLKYLLTLQQSITVS